MKAETGSEDSILAQTALLERFPPRGAKGITLIAAVGGATKKKIRPVICDELGEDE